jgi:hypothetical protein
MCDYEASGGLQDLEYTFPTIEEAKDYVEDANENRRFIGDHSEILDSSTWKIVCYANHGYPDRGKSIKWETPTGTYAASFSVGTPKQEKEKIEKMKNAINLEDIKFETKPTGSSDIVEKAAEEHRKSSDATNHLKSS